MTPNGNPRGRQNPLTWLVTPAYTRPWFVIAATVQVLWNLCNLAADNNLIASATVSLIVIALRRRARRGTAR